jgi:hypothetical protein
MNHSAAVATVDVATSVAAIESGVKITRTITGAVVAASIPCGNTPAQTHADDRCTTVGIIGGYRCDHRNRKTDTDDDTGIGFRGRYGSRCAECECGNESSGITHSCLLKKWGLAVSNGCERATLTIMRSDA